MNQTAPDDQVGRMRIFQCDSETEAYGFLARSHSDNYLYRGQTGRHPRRYPPEDRPPLRQHQFSLDSLVPTDYRGFEDEIEKGNRSALPEWFSDDAAALRFVLTHALVEERCNQLSAADAQAVEQWKTTSAQGRETGTLYDALGSLGQHYEFSTGYLDATSSIEVALWFATHDWAIGNYLAHNRVGVIYRIDSHALARAEAECNQLQRSNALNAGRELQGREFHRHVDIRNTPRLLGERPANQQGWSLINFELASLQLRLIQLDGIAAIGFPRRDAIVENNLQAAFVRPTTEPIYHLFESVRNGAIWTPVRQRWVDDELNARPHAVQIDLHDPKYLRWIVR